MFSVCDIDNMNSNTTNKTRTGPKRVRTQEPEEEQATPKTPFHTKFANESRKRCSRTVSCVAPYKPTTPNPPFQQQDYYCPLQTIRKKVDHATNGTGYKLCTTLRQGNRFQNHSVDWCEGG